MSIPYWVIAVVFLGHYWPITLTGALIFLLIAKFGTRKTVWRVFWSILAIILIAPVLLWLYV